MCAVDERHRSLRQSVLTGCAVVRLLLLFCQRRGCRLGKVGSDVVQDLEPPVFQGIPVLRVQDQGVRSMKFARVDPLVEHAFIALVRLSILNSDSMWSLNTCYSFDGQEHQKGAINLTRLPIATGKP